jgi:hypothetical protein
LNGSTLQVTPLQQVRPPWHVGQFPPPELLPDPLLELPPDPPLEPPELPLDPLLAPSADASPPPRVVVAPPQSTAEPTTSSAATHGESFRTADMMASESKPKAGCKSGIPRETRAASAPPCATEDTTTALDLAASARPQGIVTRVLARKPSSAAWATATKAS